MRCVQGASGCSAGCIRQTSSAGRYSSQCTAPSRPGSSCHPAHVAAGHHGIVCGGSRGFGLGVRNSLNTHCDGHLPSIFQYGVVKCDSDLRIGLSIARRLGFRHLADEPGAFRNDHLAVGLHILRSFGYDFIARLALARIHRLHELSLKRAAACELS